MNPRYTIEKDLEILHSEGKNVLMYTVIGSAWVILWYDDLGYTVSVATERSRSNGAALPINMARADFRAAVESILP